MPHGVAMVMQGTGRIIETVGHWSGTQLILVLIMTVINLLCDLVQVTLPLISAGTLKCYCNTNNMILKYNGFNKLKSDNKCN